MLTRAAAHKINVMSRHTVLDMSDAEVDTTQASVGEKDELIESLNGLQQGLLNLTTRVEQIANKSTDCDRISQAHDSSPMVPAKMTSSPLSDSRLFCCRPQIFNGKDINNFLLAIENYTNAYQLNSSQKLTTLVSYLGSALTNYRTWAATNPTGTYEDLIDHLKIIYGAQPNTLMAKVNFRNLKRKPSQSFEEYLTDLQEAALVAYQGQSLSAISSAVIEQFLLGLKHTKVQEVLMQDDYSSPILLLQRAQKVRDSLSICSTNSKETTPLVSAVIPKAFNSRMMPQNQPYRSERHSLKCWNCGKPGHRAIQCYKPVANKQVGHKQEACQANRQSGKVLPGMSRGSTNLAKFN